MRLRFFAWGLGCLLPGSFLVGTASAQSLELTSPAWEYNCGDSHIPAEPLVPFDVYLNARDLGEVSLLSFQFSPGGSQDEIVLLETEFYGEPLVIGDPLRGVGLYYDEPCLSVPEGENPRPVARLRLMLLANVAEREIWVQAQGQDCGGEDLGVGWSQSLYINLPVWTGLFANVRHLDAPERIVAPGQTAELPITWSWEHPDAGLRRARCLPDPDDFPRSAQRAEIELRWDPSQVDVDDLRHAAAHPAIAFQADVDRAGGVARVTLESQESGVDATSRGAEDALLRLDLRLREDAAASAIIFGPVVVRAEDGDRLPVRLSSGSIGIRSIATEALHIGAWKARW